MVMSRGEVLALDAKTGGINSSALALISREAAQAIRQFGDDYRSMDRYRPGATRQRIDAAIPQQGVRQDAFNPEAGLAMTRELEHRYAEVLREKYPVPTGLTLFPIDTSVTPGARYHTVKRLYDQGEAAVYRAGMEIPTVGINAVEEIFPVRHYVTSFTYDIFEAMSAQYMNFAKAAELLRVSRDIMVRFANRKTWYGDDTHGIYGVLNYPWLRKMVSSTAVNSSSTAQDLLDLLNFGANYAEENSDEVFSPNACVTTKKVYNRMKNTYLGDDKSRTVLRAFLEDNPNISEIKTAPELSGVGPGGTDGILFYRDDRLGISNVIVQPYTTLPQQMMGVDWTTYGYMTHGGVIMRDAGNNLLIWVDTSESS